MLPALLANPAVLATGAAVVAGGSKFIAQNGKLILAGVAGWYLLNQYKKQQEKQTSDQLGTDPNVNAAVALQNAFTPWGSFFGGGTDEAAIMAIAPTITDWAACQTAYKNLYGGNLTERLQDELSAEDLQKFLTLLTKAKTDNTPSAVYERNKKAWQSSWKTLAGKSGAVYNRYLGEAAVWYRTGENGNQRYASKKTVNLTDYIKLGTTDGSNTVTWGNTPGFIKIITTDPKIIQLMGNSMFWMLDVALMGTAPPARPK
jgi:hypothetical protein